MVVVHNTTRYLYLHYFDLLCAFVERGMRVTVVAPGDAYCEPLQAAGIRCVDLRVAQHSMNPVKEARTILQLGRILRRERPDVLFNFSIKPVIYGSLVGRMIGLHRVHSMITGLGYVFIEGGVAKRILRRMVVALYRSSLKENETVFFQNHHDKDCFIGCRIASERQCCVLPGTGIGTDSFSPAPGRRGGVAFVMATRLIAEKGVREYAQAAGRLKSRYDSVRFLLAGAIDDSPSSVDARELDEWGADGSIEYAGALEDVRPLLHESDVLVLPSYYREGLPRSLIEAMACGLPVITTDWPGCRDCVDDGVSGFLVAPRDSRALEQAMLRFIEEPGLSERMGKAARSIVVEKYSVERVNAIVLDRVLGRGIGQESTRRCGTS